MAVRSPAAPSHEACLDDITDAAERRSGTVTRRKLVDIGDVRLPVLASALDHPTPLGVDLAHQPVFCRAHQAVRVAQHVEERA